MHGLAGETSVITRQGTRPIASLAGSVHVLLTRGGEWVEAPVRLLGRQHVWDLLLSRSGVVKALRTTAGQAWSRRGRGQVEEEVVTSHLRTGDRLQFAFAARPGDLAVRARDAARGFVYGDGSTTSVNRSCANFCGDKDAHLLPLFDGLGRPPRRYADLVRINGLPREWKTDRAALDDPAAQIYGWLAGYFAADGDVDRTGRPTLASASRDDLEHVRSLCQTVGVGTFGVRTRMRSGYGVQPSEIHLVGLMRGDLDAEFFLIPEHRRRFLVGRSAAERRGWNVVSVRSTSDVDEVYCAAVERTAAFALADNILTRCHHACAKARTPCCTCPRPRGG